MSGANTSGQRWLAGPTNGLTLSSQPQIQVIPVPFMEENLNNVCANLDHFC